MWALASGRFALAPVVCKVLPEKFQRFQEVLEVRPLNPRSASDLQSQHRNVSSVFRADLVKMQLMSVNITLIKYESVSRWIEYASDQARLVLID